MVSNVSLCLHFIEIGEFLLSFLCEENERYKHIVNFLVVNAGSADFCITATSANGMCQIRLRLIIYPPFPGNELDNRLNTMRPHCYHLYFWTQLPNVHIVVSQIRLCEFSL